MTDFENMDHALTERLGQTYDAVQVGQKMDRRADNAIDPKRNCSAICMSSL
jgi:hypothetical protein